MIRLNVSIQLREIKIKQRDGEFFVESSPRGEQTSTKHTLHSPVTTGNQVKAWLVVFESDDDKKVFLDL